MSQVLVGSHGCYRTDKMNSLELHQLVNQIQLNQLTFFGQRDFDPTDLEHISYL
jgi:hypothetical protein